MTRQRYRTQYGLLDDWGDVIRWLDWPPTSGAYITRRVPLPARVAPTPEPHEEALW